MSQLETGELLQLELFTGEDILRGTISCPSTLRLLDILNQAKEFCVFNDFYRSESDANRDKTNYLCVRTGAIYFVAVDKPDTGRGVKAERKEWFGFPVISKTQEHVTVRLQNFVINGDIHLVRGQTLADIMNDERSFLPLTSVTINAGSNDVLSRPFVAVNKRQLILIKHKDHP